MKKTTPLVSSALLVLLAACAQTGMRSEYPQQAAVQYFECDNGLTASIRNAGGDKIRIRVQNRESVMSLAPSGSGERYVSDNGLWGSGGEWHQKGSEAYFAYAGVHGVQGATTCRFVR